MRSGRLHEISSPVSIFDLFLADADAPAWLVYSLVLAYHVVHWKVVHSPFSRQAELHLVPGVGCIRVVLALVSTERFDHLEFAVENIVSVD